MIELVESTADAISKVLIVDDEKLLVSQLALRYESEEFEVCRAYNGKDGWEIFLSEKPDCIITDVQMPGGSGRELIEKLATCEETKPVVLCMTAYSELEEKDAYLQGVDAFFTKPSDTDALVNATRHFLNKRRNLNDSQATIDNLRRLLKEAGRLSKLSEVNARVTHETSEILNKRLASAISDLEKKL